MDELKNIVKKSYTFILAHLNKFYDNLDLIFKKYKIINELYEPKLNEKNKINSLLLARLNKLKDTNSKLAGQINEIDKENIILQKKINIMQELILRK